MNFITKSRKKYIVPSPKDIARRRLDRNKIMKLPWKDFNTIPAERPIVINPHSRAQKKTLYRINVKDHGPTNPFQVQHYKDVSKHRHIKRKVLPEPSITDDVKTVCDIHRLFYKDIEGRPVRLQRDHKKYMRQLRGILLSNADTGYINDQILHIDETMKSDEKGNWEKIVHAVKEASMYFLLFVQLDFETGEHSRKKAKYVGNQLERMNDMYADIAYDYAKLKNEIFVVCTKFETLSIYANFLYKVAPPGWRVKYDHQYVEESKFFKNLFLDDELSHTDIVKAVSCNLKDNSLYFHTPDQLLTLLEDIANQCLTYMQIHIMSTEALHPIFTAKIELLSQVQIEADRLQYLTSKFENRIAYWEKKEIEFQVQFYKILKIEISKLYCSLEVCKLMTCVQFVCNTVLHHQDDPRDSIFDLTSFIEKEYERLRFNLDSLDVKIVKKAIAELMTKDITKMQNTEKSQRTIKEWNLMRKSLRASFEPPRYKNYSKCERNRI